MKLYEMPAADLSRLMRAGEVSAREVLRSVFDRIRETEERIGAYLTLCEEQALGEAFRIDELRARGEALPPLAGIPLAVKDNICTAGVRTTCASRMLENFIPPYSATAFERARAAGLILVGKANMDEFAMGSSTENSALGRTRNPHGTDRVPGGSSGGCAAALAAGEAVCALGSDTGGSIRQPAAFCGVVGFKPTYGAVSRYGLVAYASSFDQIGPMARTVEDAAMLMDAICGPDDRDATCARREYPKKRREPIRNVKGLRIGLPREYFGPGIDRQVKEAVLSAGDLLAEHGAEILEVSLPGTGDALSAYYVISCAEASSNLAMYDGVRYGYRAPGCRDLDELYGRSRSQGFGEEVKRRILLGTAVLSAGYQDAFYRRAVGMRKRIQKEFARAFSACDLLLTPTAPTTAFKIGEKSGDPVGMYASDVCTVTANLAGLPAISLPCGRDAGGMPIGMQLLGPPFSEGLLLETSAFFETASGGFDCVAGGL